MKKQIRNIAIILFVILFGSYLFIWGGNRLLQSGAKIFFFPGMTYVSEQKEENQMSFSWAEVVFPLYQYVKEHAPISSDVEDLLTYELILAQQANDEYSMSEDLKSEGNGSSETVSQSTVKSEISLEKFEDFNELLSKFYTVDSTTTIGPDQLNVNDLMSRSMKINQKKDGPKVLIFHTHSQEEFRDSVKGDSSTTIVGVGKYLAEKLNKKGIETMHHDGVYDLIGGKLDRSKAYQMAEKGVKEILNQNPSIEVVIDLHRDGVPENMHLVTTVDGKKAAKIMFFNGLSRTKSNGDIAYLKNPYIQDNLSFSFQMQLASESMYPGLARRIYLKGYRYSLHMMPKSLLIEAGAQTNTVKELKNAMDLLANVLEEVLL